MKNKSKSIDRVFLTSRRARGLLLGTMLSGSLLAGTEMAVAQCINTPNSTTCSGGSLNSNLQFVDANEEYVAGNFDAIFNNFTLHGGVAVIESFDPDAGQAFPLQGDGSITLNNSSVNDSGDFDVGAVVFATGHATVTMIGNSSATADRAGNWVGVGVFSAEAGNATFSAGANATVLSTEGNGVWVDANVGNATVTADGDITGDRSGIQAYSNTGNTTVTTGAGSTITGTHDHGILAEVGDAFFNDDGEWEEYGGGDVTVTADGTVTGGWRGIEAWTREGNVSVTTGSTSVIKGVHDDGLRAEAGFINTDNGEIHTGGGGDVTVTANGVVTGDMNGIQGWTLEGTTTVTTGLGSEIAGNNHNGISAYAGWADYVEGVFNFAGGGDVSVTVNGSVTGGQNGIDAGILRGADGDVGTVLVTTGVESSASGINGAGINANAGWGDESFGGGNVSVNANGKVSGAWAGINAFALEGNASVVTGASSVILASDGNAVNASAGHFDTEYGGGNVDVTVNGEATGTDNGISASALDGSVTVTTGANSVVTGSGNNGISANTGKYDNPAFGGNVTVTANGQVTGFSRGISAGTDGEGTVSVTTGTSSVITGENDHGIQAYAGNGDEGTGGGDVSVAVNGEVTGGERGIDARVLSGTVSVITGEGSVVVGNANDGIGVSAGNGDSGVGGGNVSAVVNGHVTGGRAGVHASSYAGNVSVTTGATAKIVGLDGAGIDAFSKDSGNVNVINGGTVSGNWTGIFAGAEHAGAEISVHNLATGVIGNLSGSTYDKAIETDVPYEGTSLALAAAAASGVTVINDGTVVGVVRLHNAGSLTNNGLWSFNDHSHMDNGTLTNSATGIMHVANDADDTEEETSVRADGGFINLGLISLADVTAKADVQDSDRFNVDSDYMGGGVVELNAYLGDADSSADTFNVYGFTTGVTTLRIVNTNAGGGQFVDEATGDGIFVAGLWGGSEDDVQNIVLEGGTINAGFFDYYLVESEDGSEYQLFSKFNGSVAEAAVAPSAAANVWHQTEAAWEERQQVLRDATRRITAVSDVGIAEDKGHGNLWLQVLGGRIDQDGSSTYNGLTFASGYEQTSQGLVGGVDMEAAFSGGSLLFGVLAGYTSSDLDFTASSNSLDFEGFSIGGYATLLNNGFFASALVKADALDMTHRLSPGLQATTDVMSIGLRGDLGYRMGGDGFVFEPSISLSHISTSIDGYTLGLSSFGSSKNDDTSIGAGLRGTFTGEQSSVALIARLWNDLSSDNSVEVDLAGLAPADAVDAGTFDGIYGELGADASFRFMESSFVFAGARVKFDDEATSMSGNLGVNIVW